MLHAFENPNTNCIKTLRGLKHEIKSRSNKEIYAQIVDDVNGKTLAAASSRDKDIADSTKTKIELSKLVGISIGSKAVKAGIEKIGFDRSGYLYHGRVKSLAEGAREAGLKF